MTSDDELRRVAVGAVQARHSKGTEFDAVTIYRGFFDGDLVVVEFKDADGDEDDNSVHVQRGSNSTAVFTDLDELASFVNDRRTPKSLYNVMTDVLLFSGVSGVIALLLTITICATSFFHPEAKVPEQMWQALTVILGFYFGSKVAGK